MRTPGFKRTLPLICAALFTASQSAAEDSTSVTIYSTAQPGAVPVELYRPLPNGNDNYGRQSYGGIPGFAVVRQDRELQLGSGRTELRFVDVAALIEPTTVRFESLTDPEGTQVLEQNYQFDLVSQQKMIERYLDREITVEQTRGNQIETFRGRLLSAAGGLTLQDAGGGIRTLSGWSGIEFPELPGGLITRPTLVWDLESRKSGKHRTRVSYQTQGMTWWADYNLVFSPGASANKGLLDVGAWVSILNQSGASYEGAKLKLVAGDVHRAAAAGTAKLQVQMRMAVEESNAPGFEEKAFFEYHLYTLGRPTTLPDNSTKQLELFDTARNVAADKVLVYYGLSDFGSYYPSGPTTDRNFGIQGNAKVDVYLRFKNAEANGLGVPLPAGRIRVSQLDPDDGSLEFIGEDLLDHTPRDEEVLIQLGSAFDVVGERQQVDFKTDTARKWMEETIEVTLRNHKDEAVDVIVKEQLYRWVNWEILEATAKWDKLDARTIHFPVRIEKDGETVVRYRVRYSW